MCEGVCADFCVVFPELQASCLHLLGHRQDYPNRSIQNPNYEHPDPNLYHVVCLLPGDQVIDLTYRQLDKQSPQFYHYQTLDAIRQNWFFISPTWDGIDNFLTVRVSLQQGEKAWYHRACGGNYTEEAWLAHVAEQQRDARQYYVIVKNDLAAGTIHLPGTIEDNPHLQKITEEWPKHPWFDSL